MPSSLAFCTRRRSSTASWRMRALLSRRNFSTWSSVVIPAACTAATWRAWNSERVTMSPFTLATTRSTISAGAAAARASRLRVGRSFRDLMVHLGAGHHRPHEFTPGFVRLLAQDLGPDALARLVEGGLAG